MLCNVMNRSSGLALLALTLLSAAAMGQTTPYQSAAAAAAGTRMDAMCPDAMREAEELQARRKPTPLVAKPTRPALRENLLRMAKLDQDARAFLLASGWHLDTESPEAHWMQTVDTANLKRLKHIVDQDGFPTAAMVGLDGVDAAWLLAIHANNGDFQQKVLMLTAEHVRRGEVSADQVAMLTDDWLTARGRPQRYATNFDMRDGKVTFGPIEDVANVDRRRRAAGLGTLANYACLMRAMYGTPDAGAARP